MTQSNDTYNGWTNYETWNVKLWIDNDQYLQEHFLDIASESGKDELIEALQDQFENVDYPLTEASMYMDLLNSALGNVNWREIAEALIEDAEDILDN